MQRGASALRKLLPWLLLLAVVNALTEFSWFSVITSIHA